MIDQHGNSPTRPQAHDEDADTEGHRQVYAADAAAPAEDTGRQDLNASDDDDTEGHRLIATADPVAPAQDAGRQDFAAADDDTEGHIFPR